MGDFTAGPCWSERCAVAVNSETTGDLTWLVMQGWSREQRQWLVPCAGLHQQRPGKDLSL